MLNRTNRSHASIPILLALLVLLASVAASVRIVGAGQGTNLPSPVDLATVPLHPSSLPEPGFQLAQAGDLELGAVQASWSVEGVGDDAWGPIARAYR
ncbi:MAG: hypothetical protein M3457_03005, partial [Chloroflexota bacterium]|nr:hypothetical protein [Chloroflexota bacterium]